MKRPEVKISIPDNLKVQLVDDWEAITKNQQVRRHFTAHFRRVLISRHLQLVPLPRVPNVEVILDEWLIYLQNEEEEKKRCVSATRPGISGGVRGSFPRALLIRREVTHRIAAEVAAGLGLYFNKALGNNLLYRFERGQYQEHYKRLQGTGKAMSSVYGGEHLLRLFGTLSARTLVSLPHFT